MLTLPHLFAYTEWANAAVLAQTARSEWVWLQRWTGTSPTTPPAWTAGPTPTALRAALDDVEREVGAVLATLTDADLAAPRAYTLFSEATPAEPLGVQMHSVVDHST